MHLRFVNSKKIQEQMTFKGTWCRYDIYHKYIYLRLPGANPQAAAQAVEVVDVGRALLPSLLLCFFLWYQFDAFFSV